MDPDVLGVPEAEPGQLSDGRGLCGGEQQSLSGPGEVLHDGVYGVSKAHVQDTICLVEDWRRTMEEEGKCVR